VPTLDDDGTESLFLVRRAGTNALLVPCGNVLGGFVIIIAEPGT